MSPKRSMAAILLLGGVLVASALTLVSWTGQQPSSHFTGDRFENDTLPKKERSREKVRNIEEAIEEVEMARVELKKNLEKDFARMQEELAAGLKEFDAGKIRMEMEKSLKEVDFEKMQKELKESLAKMEAVDKAELKRELAKMEGEMEKAKAEFEKMKEKDFVQLEKELAKTREELKNLQPQWEAELKKAEKELEKAKRELEETKTFIDQLHKAGLIDKEKPYTIEHKKGALIINGTKQSDGVYDQYKDYLKKHPEFKIIKELENFQIRTGSSGVQRI